METTIFVDMDGVVADFAGGALAVHGKSIPPNEIIWDFPSQVGFKSSFDPTFWKPLENVDFWSNLSPLTDGIGLFRRLELLVGKNRLGILSSGLAPGSCDGKRIWLDRQLPGHSRGASFCTEKWRHAAPMKLLIDDHEPNVDDFVKHHGMAVLIPRPWNRRRSETCGEGCFDPGKLFNEIKLLIGA